MTEQDRLRLQQEMGMYIPHGMSPDRFGHQEILIIPKLNYYMHPRITPVWIKDLDPFEIFFFGSNLQGIMGAGGAKQALKWGARKGKGVGLSGQTYAIPTRNYLGYSVEKQSHQFENLPLDEIAVYVRMAIDDIQNIMKSRKCFITEIGCGNAGYAPEQIAPLFKGCLELENVWLPQKFIDVLKTLK